MRILADVDTGIDDACALLYLCGRPEVELVGITTLSAFRGRGIGMQVTAYLAQQAFLQGADLVFLDAVDEQAVRVYQRVGFQPYTHLLTYQHDHEGK